jgi:hypothetical protein
MHVRKQIKKALNTPVNFDLFSEEMLTQVLEFSIYKKIGKSKTHKKLSLALAA